MMEWLFGDGEDFPASAGSPPIDGRQWFDFPVGAKDTQQIIVFPRHQPGIVLQEGPKKPILPFVEVDNTLAEAYIFVYENFIKDGKK